MGTGGRRGGGNRQREIGETEREREREREKERERERKRERERETEREREGRESGGISRHLLLLTIMGGKKVSECAGNLLLHIFTYLVILYSYEMTTQVSLRDVCDVVGFLQVLTLASAPSTSIAGKPLADDDTSFPDQ